MMPRRPLRPTGWSHVNYSGTPPRAAGSPRGAGRGGDCSNCTYSRASGARSTPTHFPNSADRHIRCNGSRYKPGMGRGQAGRAPPYSAPPRPRMLPGQAPADCASSERQRCSAGQAERGQGRAPPFPPLRLRKDRALVGELQRREAERQIEGALALRAPPQGTASRYARRTARSDGLPVSAVPPNTRFAPPARHRRIDRRHDHGRACARRPAAGRGRRRDSRSAPPPSRRSATAHRRAGRHCPRADRRDRSTPARGRIAVRPPRRRRAPVARQRGERVGGERESPRGRPIILLPGGQVAVPNIGEDAVEEGGQIADRQPRQQRRLGRWQRRHPPLDARHRARDVQQITERRGPTTHGPRRARRASRSGRVADRGRAIAAWRPGHGGSATRRPRGSTRRAAGPRL